MIFVCCFDSLNQDSANVKVIMFPVCKGFFVRNNLAVRILSSKFDFVMVTMLVRNKNYVGWHIVPFAFIWIYINETVIISGQSETAVSLI